MQEIPILTNDLAGRIERLVAPEPKPHGGDPTVPVVVEFGKAIASKMKGGQPSNKVYCFNEADLPLLDDILAFYRNNNLEPWFYLTPVGFTHAVAVALSAAGFVQRDFNQAILYGLPSAADFKLEVPMAIERVTQGNLLDYAITMADGFEWDSAWRDTAIKDVIQKFNSDTHSFLLRWDGEPAAVATFGQRGSVGKIVGGAVVPKHRHRGCHLALVRHRVRLAQELGCGFLMGAANYGSPSFRNQLRVGLQLAYVESSWGPH